VFHFPDGAALAVDVRGGAAAYVGDYGWTHAICLTGGSAYGLEAVAGVAAELLAQRGYDTSWDQIALVAGAVIYDFGPRDNAIYPDKALGRAALRAAQPGSFPLGPHGAGCSASVGKAFGDDCREMAGQGGAFHQVGSTKIAVFTVVNALGVIVDRAGRVVRGDCDTRGGPPRSFAELARRMANSPKPVKAPPPGNTTLTVLVTNRQLDSTALRQLARQVHASMARAIQPFHTPYDGDVLFAVSTGEVAAVAGDEVALGVIASELAWDAVLVSFDEDE
jgi:L-aminopeptidase/D-esterase-like protein